ncbi:MAG: sulfatase-like hydrolase/transferase, partial [Lentisphaeria bacterium]|nr:sulfatase-like hydrolase/transferase [Lentisphaeria bacterium]NQZ70255.1 sulfatase-like hydrolase/transferase [Lentisphaeria bacterium]
MSKKPNIILFFTDQLRADALACYGNDICKTPNLDKLATESIVFDYAYCPISVCSPSRASLMSGLYPHNHKTMINTHIAPAFNVGLPLETPTFSKVLKEHGYAMDYIGKWHVNEEHDPTEFGFDRHLEIIPDETINMIKEEAVFLDFPGGENLMCAPSKCSVEETRTGLLMDKAQQFIKERAQQEQAFFLRMDTSAPHFFNIIPEPYASMYDPESIPPWGNFDESFEGKPDGHLRKHQEWHLEDKDWSWWQKLLAFYYGDVSMQDYFVGQMLDCIKDAGIEDNTIFIFASDHGDSMGSHKHFEKGGTMYEEVMRVPLIIKMPNGEGAGTRCKEFVQLMDLMPT